MNRSVILGGVLLLAAAAAGGASANGGPVAWTDPSPLGGITPAKGTGIRLVTEDLSIVLEDDLEHYRVVAKYVLSNPGGPKKVQYGVPITWSAEVFSGWGTEQSGDEEVRIVVDGRGISCREIRADEVNPGEPLGVEFPVQFGGEGYIEPPAVRAWCLAEIEIPAGDAIPLELRYRAGLWFTDLFFSKSAQTVFDSRHMVYPLFPASFWEGRVDRIDVEVDTGPYGALARPVYPEGWEVAGSKLRWSAENADLAEIAYLRVNCEAVPLLRHRQLASWNRDTYELARVPLTARASSALESQGGNRYDPANAVDGRVDTAWCEGTEGSGVGEWIELTVGRPAGIEEVGPWCRAETLALVPGYAKSEGSWSDNGRMRRVRVAPCGDLDAGVDVDLGPPSTRHDTAAITLRSREGGPVGDREDHQALMLRLYGDLPIPDVAGRCVRITILEVEPGAEHQDTCLSEFVPIFNCG